MKYILLIACGFFLGSSNANALGGRPIATNACKDKATTKYVCSPGSMAQANGFEQLSMSYCDNFIIASTVQHGEAKKILLKLDYDFGVNSNGTNAKLYFDSDANGEVPTIAWSKNNFVSAIKFSIYNTSDTGIRQPTSKEDFIRNTYAHFTCEQDFL